MAWDVAVPASGDSISSGDDVIRELKTDLQTALQAHGQFPINASSPKYQYTGDRGATGSLPTNGEGGIYFDTDTNEILRDNGSSWDQVGVNFDSGTAMVFYQASAPTGWTKAVSQNDKFLRVVSGTGGGSGGTTAASAAHGHTVPEHFHDIVTDGGSGGSLAGANDANVVGGLANTNRKFVGNITSSNDGDAGFATTDDVTYAYIDVIVCTKD